MKIRRTTLNDLEHLLTLFEGARAFMRQTGNHQQWNQGYPSVEILKNDIETGQSYFVCHENDDIIGTLMFHIGEDHTYRVIDGKWLNDEPYGVIHRIASNQKVKGIGQFVFDWALQQCPNLRIDTHQDNQVMRNLLMKEGFIECGIIYLENKEPRIAYHKVKKEST